MIIEYIISCPDKESADEAERVFRDHGFLVERLDDTLIKATAKGGTHNA